MPPKKSSPPRTMATLSGFFGVDAPAPAPAAPAKPRRRRLIKAVATKYGVVIPPQAPYAKMQSLIASIPRNPVLKTLPLLIKKKQEKREATRISTELSEAIKRGITGIIPRGKMRVSVKFNARLSDEVILRTLPPFEYEGNNVQGEIARRITEYLNHQNWELIPDGTTIRITQKRKTREFDYAQNRMRDQQPFNLSVNIFRNLIEVEPSVENCVKTYLRKAYPDISKQKKDPIGNLGNEDGVTPEELKEFCKQRHIKMIAYNTNKEVIATYKPEVFSKKYKALIYLYYGNHIYPIDNKYLETKTNKIVKSEYLTEEALADKFNELITAHILPSDIIMKQDQVSSFIHESTHYFHNPEYEDCLILLTAFGIEDKIEPRMGFITAMDCIETIYTQSQSSPYTSFFPIDHIKTPFYYNTKHDGRPTTTIDKNKAYSHAFMNLPYLLTTDYRQYPIQDNPTAIEENALYIATPKTPNILMPKQDIYSGQHLLFCSKKFSFTLQERINCKKHDNIYNEIIQDLQDKIPNDLFKRILNKLIGSYARSPSKHPSSKATLVNDDDRNPNHYHIPYGKYYLQLDTEEHVRDLYNRRPIAIQIKDRTAQTIYEKMVELKLRDTDIVQIKTDSITFYTGDRVIVEEPEPVRIRRDGTPNIRKIRIGKLIDDWKLETYKPSLACIYDQDPPTITMKQHLANDNTLITGYAGNGKSYYIQNTLVPQDPDYLILSSKHSALTQHRTNNLNADVIQAYAWGRSIPKEHHLIVEECGILSRYEWDILFKCFLMGKKLTVLGDFQQLLPYGEHATFNSPAFLNWLFTNQTQMNTNWRNNFSTTYYDSLINSKDQSYLKQEILKYSTKNPEDAEVIFAYRNKTVDQYNDYMLNYLNKTLDDPDVPMICTTNKLRDHNIFNQYQFTTQEIRDQINDPEFDMEKHFRPAYARTLYNLQGDQVKSYYIAPEDIDYFAKPREAYTIISRIKH